MDLFSVELPGVVPDPFALARTLGDRTGVALLWLGGVERAFLTCDPIAEVRGRLDPEPNLPLAPELSMSGHYPRWIGLLPYEACRGLERSRPAGADPRACPQLTEHVWRRYAAVAEIGQRVRILGDDSARVRELAGLIRREPRRGPEPQLEFAQPPEAEARHIARIRCALERIAAGQLYQVNLARRFTLRARGEPWDLLQALSRRGTPSFGAALRWPEISVIAASPELFLDLSAAGRVSTSPIKGTRPRGSSALHDAELMAELDSDPKERAELTMVIDVERNDLARVARTGTIRLSDGPRVQTHPTIHHRLATLEAELRSGISRAELLSRMLPSGSVTGAPKLAAMDLIAELEAERRGLYTGAFGAIWHDGGLRLGMAIRVLSVVGDSAHYFAGGGIVADSSPEREVEETLWKARAIIDFVARRPKTR